MCVYLVVILSGFEASTHYVQAADYVSAEKHAIKLAGNSGNVLLCKLLGKLEKPEKD
ncbi:hypothetical protein Barba22A_gp049 [Rheinheimera phage vB_RspM_Barba22A]|jgi:hypothetical protein|uniref:Uncharacterized protein n=82 Tax=Barbavirus TaxID=2733095 RepID=A0A7G9VRS2_9CAUD|nr:hypothetical protein HOV44_gp053 [Rheinheimera phage Barba5S]YP_009822786.1 hypothetical protein HOV45_gp050 [Rheinheimera phage Barba8S]YP_009822926.1 hypothetical protein HOV46_gp049 [Rheinheimera phage vB_RspM_Barba18A]YP_009823205.1 hypothetical protein HOV48_gp049 [Rheinheimera phage Barba21A]QCQ57900.1 hypothetical protein Barba1A_gp049 [Rheinheimera phage vB_RspM_Barba1A]QCQ58036.1 hypothetical protein Barba1S_gp049 [Rheinheimera phage vB_RspM_Barba1S]QCQ58172.1 hypothetical protein